MPCADIASGTKAPTSAADSGVRVPEKPDRNAVEVKGVSKVFGSGDAQFAALKDVDVAIRENEFFTLLGPSGGGKTTRLGVIAGSDSPTSVEICRYV